MANVVDWFLL